MSSKKEENLYQFNFDAIVLSGGGSKGILTLGALHYYYTIGKIVPSRIKEYAGASIGSVICLLMICGYTPMEIFTELYSAKNFFELQPISSSNILHNIKNMGIMNMDSFIDKIKELVIKKLGGNYTLRKIYEITGKKLYISATDVSNVKEVKYSYLTIPEINCIDAVKHSCNIPMLFHRINYNHSYMVDGAVSNNYPWDYISNDCKNILGMFITGVDCIFKEDNFLGYSHRIIITPIKILSDIRCELAPDKIKTIKLRCEGVLSFNLSSSQKMDNFLKGYQQASEQDSIVKLYVKGWNEDEKILDEWRWDELEDELE